MPTPRLFSYPTRWPPIIPALPGTCLIVICLLALTACSGTPRLESRDGYRVDHRYQSSAQNSRVQHLVLHYTDSNARRSLRTLTGPDVSSHYLVTPTAPPTVYQLVDEARRAWHAGVSAWHSRTHLNDTSIGIEIVNEGPRDTPHGRTWTPYPARQIDTLIALARDIIERHAIDPVDVVGHADIAPRRKIDPGPRFPWYRLYRAGIGAWPASERVMAYQRRFMKAPPSLTQFQRALAAYGYPVAVTGRYDALTHDSLRAFQMHFRPTRHDGYPDAHSAAILWALLEKYRPEALADMSP
ncbi:N-acetyl-anhydromuramyl-L-alanine amidase AmpD [Chromohalobacter marismortui]|uniref:N-acetylmuramoyl-L-alanine amidase n=1 Tax=Chromohalobacter marismortui TaxID=42055 RepID=A0A4V6Q468_9GAMM|nr:MULTISPECIES: N-acetylmuramoyl-L-alanine amidase [Chromohalobacter]MCI0510329.1 N-acetylmuramoyl-L-alanine amidase [Chromohalobacter sp.]MCI0592729.1 N-acetylmuramoyl-L-alanine amidase [Chromohalobacter sp.]TDU25096.1 N-acetyl-anhydromuramyl-L-alanine amidase AmpD [Chromohalobacter marismortui]